jgi:diacylglycerol kinase family enzyme
VTLYFLGDAALKWWFRRGHGRRKTAATLVDHVATGRDFRRLGRAEQRHSHHCRVKPMHFIAVLNRDGGTFRSTDLGPFVEGMHETLTRAGHQLDVEIVVGASIERALANAAQGLADVVIAGGGDGTISAAAAALMDKTKSLAVLPAGTMNLFARSLGIPLSLDAAIEVFAAGEVRRVDMASANGRPFIHQFSVGMHPKMVGIRDSMAFASRLGKMRASVRAALVTILDPPTLKVSLEIGDAEVLTRATAISVTNNLFGEGHLPYADHPDGGALGIYITVTRQKAQMLRMLLHLARGKWHDNPHVEIHETEKAVLKMLSRSAGRKCVVDGELLPLQRETAFAIHKKVLNVIVPSQST